MHLRYKILKGTTIYAVDEWPILQSGQTVPPATVSKLITERDAVYDEEDKYWAHSQAAFWREQPEGSYYYFQLPPNNRTIKVIGVREADTLLYHR